jgi:DNA-binding CsgD family transcriptional regulator
MTCSDIFRVERLMDELERIHYVLDFEVLAEAAFFALGLTPSEREVLRRIIQDKRHKEVAEVLSASPQTIHNHLRSILQTLNAKTRTAAAAQPPERLKRSHALDRTETNTRSRGTTEFSKTLGIRTR